MQLNTIRLGVRRRRAPTDSESVAGIAELAVMYTMAAAKVFFYFLHFPLYLFFVCASVNSVLVVAIRQPASLYHNHILHFRLAF